VGKVNVHIFPEGHHFRSISKKDSRIYLFDWDSTFVFHLDSKQLEEYKFESSEIIQYSTNRLTAVCGTIQKHLIVADVQTKKYVLGEIFHESGDLILSYFNISLADKNINAKIFAYKNWKLINFWTVPVNFENISIVPTLDKEFAIFDCEDPITIINTETSIDRKCPGFNKTDQSRCKSENIVFDCFTRLAYCDMQNCSHNNKRKDHPMYYI
jgi:hypothetical protein